MKASEKASVASGKAPRRIIFTFCNLPIKIVTKSRNVTYHIWYLGNRARFMFTVLEYIHLFILLCLNIPNWKGTYFH